MTILKKRTTKTVSLHLNIFLLTALKFAINFTYNIVYVDYIIYNRTMEGFINKMM